VETELAWEYSVGNLLAAYEAVFSKRPEKAESQAEVARSQN